MTKTPTPLPAKGGSYIRNSDGTLTREGGEPPKPPKTSVTKPATSKNKET